MSKVASVQAGQSFALPGAPSVRARRPLLTKVKSLVHGGLKPLLPPSWYWRLLASRMGYFDPELHLLRHVCDRTKASIDIGASGGTYTVHLLNHSKKCYAFEPCPVQLAVLIDRLATRPSPRLHIETTALSDRTGEARLRIVAADLGRSSIEATNPLECAGDIEVLTVPTRRLDDYAETMEAVGCIKIDVEGHEEAVLRGAARILARDHPSLIIEIEERHKPGSIGAVTRYLAELGYRGFFFRGGRLHAIESFNLATQQDVSKLTEKASGEPVYVNNFLFLAAGALAKVRHLLDDQ